MWLAHNMCMLYSRSMSIYAWAGTGMINLQTNWISCRVPFHHQPFSSIKYSLVSRLPNLFNSHERWKDRGAWERGYFQYVYQLICTVYTHTKTHMCTCVHVLDMIVFVVHFCTPQTETTISSQCKSPPIYHLISTSVSAGSVYIASTSNGTLTCRIPNHMI